MKIKRHFFPIQIQSGPTPNLRSWLRTSALRGHTAICPWIGIGCLLLVSSFRMTFLPVQFPSLPLNWLPTKSWFLTGSHWTTGLCPKFCIMSYLGNPEIFQNSLTITLYSEITLHLPNNTNAASHQHLCSSLWIWLWTRGGSLEKAGVIFKLEQLQPHSWPYTPQLGGEKSSEPNSSHILSEETQSFPEGG